MIKIPTNNLTKKLDAIQSQSTDDDPVKNAEIAREHDTVLASAWQTLKGTAARDALELLLVNLEIQITGTLTDPRISGDGRQFVAGQLRIVHELQTKIEEFLTFDPTSVDYAAEAEAEQFGDPDATEGYDETETY